MQNILLFEVNNTSFAIIHDTENSRFVNDTTTSSVNVGGRTGTLYNSEYIAPLSFTSICYKTLTAYAGESSFDLKILSKGERIERITSSLSFVSFCNDRVKEYIKALGKNARVSSDLDKFHLIRQTVSSRLYKNPIIREFDPKSIYEQAKASKDLESVMGCADVLMDCISRMSMVIDAKNVEIKRLSEGNVGIGTQKVKISEKVMEQYRSTPADPMRRPSVEDVESVNQVLNNNQTELREAIEATETYRQYVNTVSSSTYARDIDTSGSTGIYQTPDGRYEVRSGSFSVNVSSPFPEGSQTPDDVVLSEHPIRQEDAYPSSIEDEQPQSQEEGEDILDF